MAPNIWTTRTRSPSNSSQSAAGAPYIRAISMHATASVAEPQAIW
jgi:hypothetical protein